MEFPKKSSKVAVIGSGIGAIASAYELKKRGHEVWLFEKEDYFGGHTHTHHFHREGYDYTVDTGFLVHNDRTYPKLIKFFEELGLETYPSDMSFSVHLEDKGIEWAGANLATVFCQPKNLFNFRFHRFLKEIMRFNKSSDALIEESRGDLSLSLGKLLEKHKYGKDFQDWYLLPMGGCIWSSPTHEMLNFPAFTFLNFCKNHGLLQVNNRPQWKTVVGGCHTYTLKVIEMLDFALKSEGIRKVQPEGNGVWVHSDQRSEFFDAVFFGTHPPTTLKILGTEANGNIASILGSFRYQENKAVLHTDRSFLPKNRIAWSAWNYLSVEEGDQGRAVSCNYLINKLQPLPKRLPIIVSLNPFRKPKKESIIKEMLYEHPLFDEKSVRAQELVPSIQGERNIYYAGAWMRYGFHEDGIWGAHQAVEAFDNRVELAKPFEEVLQL